MVIADSAAIDPLLNDTVLEIARVGSIGEDSAHGVLEWYGRRAFEIARMARDSAEFRAPICPHTSHVVAEAIEAYRKEFAITLADVLLRRVPVALGGCWSEACSREAALRIGSALGWNDVTRETNLEAFEIERSAFLQRATRTDAAAAR
jgi:glycerol-3-phosphate dehydrogenase